MAPPAKPLSPGIFMAGFECATQVRVDGMRLDMAAATGHADHALSDYVAAAAHGMRGARDGLRWHLIERTPGTYDWSSWLPMLDAADRAGMQVTWDLWHFGQPDGCDPLDPAFPDRFAAFARAAAELVRDRGRRAPAWCPMNEISFYAHMAGDRADAMKRALVAAAIAGARAVRGVDPACRLLWAEPLIAIAPHDEGEESRTHARDATNARYQVWDMLAGRLAPERGGSPDLLDVVGCNFYPHNQWYDHAGPTIPLGHHAWFPLAAMLAEVHDRYARPVVISETGAEGCGRAAWLHYVCDQVRDARAAGVPVGGICLYPVTNYPGWDNGRACATGLFGPPAPDGMRPVDPRVATELTRQATLFDAADAQRVT